MSIIFAIFASISHYGNRYCKYKSRACLSQQVEHREGTRTVHTNKLTREKLYRDPQYNTKRLAADLHTNTRYISAAVALCTGNNYSALVNSLRLRDVCKMMRSPKHKDMTVEEIGLLSGFSSRQAFYLAFHRIYACTPRAYRLQIKKELGF